MSLIGHTFGRDGHFGRTHTQTTLHKFTLKISSKVYARWCFLNQASNYICTTVNHFVGIQRSVPFLVGALGLHSLSCSNGCPFTIVLVHFLDKATWVLNEQTLHSRRLKPGVLLLLFLTCPLFMSTLDAQNPQYGQQSLRDIPVICNSNKYKIMCFSW
jgi:hypothetical protein